ncbi:MAG: hypothetical protein JST55_08045 [Bacteroidetes bacterium]|nr:hypothetical protein [Bacteroidota bacterium]
MNRKILYYPSIKISDPRWLRNALLYWDEVSSIIPKDYNDKVFEELSPEINYLIEEKQFTITNPETLIQMSDYNTEFIEFKNEFIQTINFFLQEGHIKRIQQGTKTIPIHQDKTSIELIDFLKDNNLIIENFNDNFYSFEEKTGLIYMSLIAKYLSFIDKNHTVIATDRIEYESLNFKKASEGNSFSIISCNLTNILPTPKENVPFEKIIDFKRNRKDNLLHFRKTLLDFEKSISKTTNVTELKEIAIQFKEDIQVGINDIKALHKDYNMEWVSKSLKSLISTKTSVASIGGILLNEPITGLVATGVNSGIELSTAYIEAKNKTRVKEREASFSYLYKAQQEGIII